MRIDRTYLSAGIAAALGAMTLGAAPAAAQEPAFFDLAEGQYILNSFSFLVHGFLVMFMACGFAMLEAGLVRTKNTSMQLLKNVMLYSTSGIMFYIVGYQLMYNIDAGGFLGVPGIWSIAGDNAIIDGASIGEAGYSDASDWFFQMVFVATAASIVSGTLAERIKLWPFAIFVVVLTAIIYPIQGSWQWGGGWLAEAGFSDFAGSTLVHSCGGWAALAGAILLGARKGKYGADGRVHPMPGANLPLATLGTMILWLGWFGFNGGSQLAMGTGADVASIAKIYMNTNLAAAGGLVMAVILTQVMYKKVDLTMALNGALAGLVSITAEPLTPVPGLSILIGAVGGVIVVFAVPLLDKLKIDDVVGAIPVHLFAGIWGTIAVVLSNPGTNIGSQLLGIFAIGAFVFAVSFAVWFILKMTLGIRVSEEEEELGLDKVELGLEAYPEFGRGSAKA
ncbi:ammonium transporter [Roseospirillum parvum]|uniref:Ammonium transporter, Amt family n=1 Tax=Roseospirillum parvum TaxID=83401 RepID=A0A1G7W324_9PROT|nr:ammonium transporter [Roseospirillum parvum]SDG66119.1 ammonium transporter, Amt family [Roseospirillum parvum]